MEERIKRMSYLSTFTKGFYMWYVALFTMFMSNIAVFLLATLVFWYIDARYLALERFFINGVKKPNLINASKGMFTSFSLYLYPLIAITVFFN